MESPAHSPGKYDVFLNFRGEDTRNTFTGHLYNALDSKGVRTFMDSYNLHFGKDIGPALLEAIEQSRISITIFSKDYSSSKWCLRELAHIFRCYKTNKQIILPIFLDVEPSVVKKQLGSFGVAFSKHEAKLKLKWKNVLTKVAELKGCRLKEVNGDESKLVQLVVERALSILDNAPFVVAKYPVEIDSRVNDLLSLIDIESMDSKFVGICGMGGIGKTTIAKAIYNRIFRKFDGSSFLGEVREQASEGLVCLQVQLLNDILGKKDSNINHVDKGSKLISDMLNRKKSLLVLDNVDHHMQLDALAGKLSWFGPGSIILITTRDKHVLQVAGVDNNHIYELQGLDDTQSLCLFNMHAFQKNVAPEDFMQFSEEIVKYARGLPLTVEVLGSLLCKTKEKEVWGNTLQKLNRVFPEEVKKRLKISYDGLNDNEKAIFLDIACFFIGMDQEVPIYIWDACGFYPKAGLKVLIQKHLVWICDENKLRMHDQLRNMGRQIVFEESLNEPRERSRLWSREEILEVFTENKGTQKVEGILLESGQEKGDSLRTENLATMSNLRLLQVHDAVLKGTIERLPSKLKWLCWQGCPLKTLPPKFCLEKLVVLNLRCSKIKEGWTGGLQNSRFQNLKVLNLYNCCNLAKSPDFSRFPVLERLILKGCNALVELDKSIGQLKRLFHLDLSNCSKLMKLPCHICELHSLQQLLLSNCSQLKELPNSISDQKSLLKVELNDTASHKLLNFFGLSNKRISSLVTPNFAAMPIKKIPSTFGQLKLEMLCVRDCKCLKSLPVLPSSLIDFSAVNCYSLERLPDLSNLKHLKKLDLQYCSKLVEIQGLEEMESLEFLNVSGCIKLKNTWMEYGSDPKNIYQDSFYEIQQLYKVDDDGIDNALILSIDFESEEEVQMMVTGLLTITACIHRNGKQISCKSDLQVRNIETRGKTLNLHNFDGLKWFGISLKERDEIRIVEFQRSGRFQKPKLQFLRLLSKDQEHKQKPMESKVYIDGELHPIPKDQEERNDAQRTRKRHCPDKFVGFLCFLLLFLWFLFCVPVLEEESSQVVNCK